MIIYLFIFYSFGLFFLLFPSCCAIVAFKSLIISRPIVCDIDGNSKAGAKRLNQLILKIRRHKNTDQHPPQAKGLGAYLNA